MLKQIRIMSRLEFSNLFGWNMLRFSRDRKQRRKAAATMLLWILLALYLAFYMGGLSYGLIRLGCGAAVPAYLIALSGLLILSFGMLKAGGILFRKEGYEILCSLPLTKTAVVAGRLCRMYVEDLVFALSVMLPGLAVYAWLVRPGIGFYLTAVATVWAVPLLPMAAAVLIGGVIAGIASGMRRKGLVTSGLSLLLVAAILYGTSRLSALEGNPDPEMLQKMAETMTEVLGRGYPPAVWLGRALTGGSLLPGLGWAGMSLAVFGGVAVCISVFFDGICRRLYRDSAKHDYRMGRLKADSMLPALCKRELRRYFSSGIYVTNTMISPIMGCVFSAVLLAGGKEVLGKIVPGGLKVELLLPFILSMMLTMLMPTSVSISLEGKNWWILKSLPLSAKNILDGKMGMSLGLVLPFYLASELMLWIALKPEPGELILLLLIPAAMIVFCCVFGITANLRFPVTDWDNEVSVVKQSASALVGGMSGLVLALVGMAGTILIPGGYSVLFRWVFSGALLLGAAFLYRKNSKYDIWDRI